MNIFVLKEIVESTTWTQNMKKPRINSILVYMIEELGMILILLTKLSSLNIQIIWTCNYKLRSKKMDRVLKIGFKKPVF